MYSPPRSSLRPFQFLFSPSSCCSGTPSMAVEARRLPLSPSQLLSNREAMMNTMEPSAGFCTKQTAYGAAPSITAADTSRLHIYDYGDTAAVPTTMDSFAPQVVKSVDVSSFTYYDGSNINCDVFPLPSRKRSRDSMATYPTLHQNSRSCAPLSFLGQDISLQIHQQQLETDRLIAFHMGRVKMEMEERRKRQVRTMMGAIEQGVMKRLRAKEEEREKLEDLNNALEERVKSLAIENQIWRDLAQTNEATAQALRTNLEQVLAQVKDMHIPPVGGARLGLSCADAGSCCGSNDGSGEEEDVERRVLAGEAQDKGRMCRSCGEEESCVVLLPCRHLCLCGVCGSTLHTCPICRSPKNASVHVNISS
ncbi:PREDICTED: probable BOI-related E3 ubiquitin-protein ligase 2 [Tarenaya hassleriana]|uniref:probable BOI-related E3 ubiquitin-protein ligase 2 n=1 Tax=Tarenaya hassleriana TaxID=28532 RepID=UPI00053C42FD|nr:PREDICTED: probable BOI-related E3 ubiquitin-protein ligase 2 [Tarenaya hassleriana]